ncbi:phage regulatory protein/antirepressor Ant [Nostoc sp.]|uniref:phage regulatory protein/antirepressor Ant n=1 Tax=Nostoc sp. TaxID=1180 RepID=UPI002FF60EAE
MSNLTIQTINDSLVVDSRLIAAELGIEHRALKKTIQTYQVDFEEFGNIDTVSADIIGPGKPETFYFLNEAQANLSLTYSNNTPIVRQAKIKLIKAFEAAKKALLEISQPKLPSSYKEALLALVEAEEEKERLALKAAEAEAKISEMAPKVEFYQRVADDTGTFSLADAAKLIKVMGRNNLMYFLREQKILQFSNVPYQKFIDQKLFTVIEKETHVGVRLTTRVTQKGIEFIIRLLEREGYIQKAS